MRYGKQLWAAAALLAAVSIASEASAGSRPPSGLIGGGFANANVSFQTIVEFGNYAAPVAILENSSINFARVIQFGGTGTVDATIVQNGTRNYVNVVQVGGTTNAAVGQFGVSSMANITQVGNSTNSLLLQVGDMNTGTIRQSGWFGWLPMLLFGR